MQAPDEAPGAPQAEQAAPAHGTAGSGRPGTGVAGRADVQRARRAAERGKQKYAGSRAECLWNRLNGVDFINQRMLFAATLLLCFFPFLIVGNALATASVLLGITGVVGLVWQERGLSFAAASRKLRRAS